MQLSRLKSCSEKYFYCAAIAVFILIVSEFIARLDDFIFVGESFFSSPNFDTNLKFSDVQFIRGKPFGRFRKCNLNGYGFRGPEIDSFPPATKARIMVIGASEAFGSCELENMEFPAQLQSLLAHRGKYEVINASIVGMSLWSTLSYWENWASRFRPDIVVVYTNPLFYLRNEPIPKLDTIPKSVVVSEKPKNIIFPEKNKWFESRLILRLHDLFHFPDWINRWRKKKLLADKRAGKSKDWYFPSLPQDRIGRFRDDMYKLADSIRKQNVKIVFVTHPIKTTIKDSAEDQLAFLGQLYYYPKASEEIIIQFNLETNRIILECAQEQGISVIDAAQKFNNHRELFDDLVHFNNEGAKNMASLISDFIIQNNVARLNQTNKSAIDYFLNINYR